MKLPFKSEPKVPSVTIGTEETGKLAIPKLGDLSPNERNFVQRQGLPNLQRKAAELAKEIVDLNRADGMSDLTLLDAYDAICQGGQAATAIFGNHIDKLLGFQELMQGRGSARTIVLATAIIRYRLHPSPELVFQAEAVIDAFRTRLTDKLDPAELNNLVTQVRHEMDEKLEIWGIANTSDASQIHPQLVKAIAEFAQNEEIGWSDPEPVTEEALGESSAA